MKYIYFTVGPTKLYPTVPAHLQQAVEEEIGSLSHRSEKFRTIYKTAAENLKLLLGVPENFHVFFTGSSLENMERIIQNCVGEGSFHVESGAFGKKFYEIALQLNKKAEKFGAAAGEGVDFSTITLPEYAEVLGLTQNETSTGIYLPMEDIYHLKENYSNVLMALDIVSSAPYVEIDYTKIDMAFLSVQKGLGLPAGLAVLLVNDKAIEKARVLREKGFSIGSYHSFLDLAHEEESYQTSETPNVLAIYLLAKVTEDMLTKGIAAIRKETDEKAQMLYEFFDTHEEFAPYVHEKKFRSPTTLVIDVKGRATDLVKQLQEQRIIVGMGYGEQRETHIRIANFPAHTKEDVQQLLDALKTISK